MSELIRSLQQHALQMPDIPAVTGSYRTLTWQSLDSEVRELSGKLMGSQTVGLLMKNSPAWVVADLASIRAGTRHVPLPTFFTDAQLLHTIRDAGIEILITDASFPIKDLLTNAKAIPVEIAGDPCVLLYLSETVSVASQQHNKLACKITYTSGSTGAPRGVHLSLDTMETVTRALCDAVDAGKDDSAISVLPLSTLLENIGSVYIPLLVGARMIVPDAAKLGLHGSSRINVQQFAATLNQFRPTSLVVPPQLLKLLVGLAGEQMLPDSFRYIAVGGAPVGQLLLDQAMSLGLPVYQGYGLSEACSVVTVNTPEHNRPGSVGKPLTHTRIRITGQGEVAVRGATFDGYLNGSLRSSSDEWPTGDLGYLDDDGYLYITGRIRNVIISSFGRNISPEWVESELLAHPAIAQAAVLGNGRPYLSAVLVPSLGGTDPAKRAALDAALIEVNDRLPDYARVREYLLADAPFTVVADEITANGRPRRDVIENRYSRLTDRLYEMNNEQIL